MRGLPESRMGQPTSPAGKEWLATQRSLQLLPYFPAPENGKARDLKPNLIILDLSMPVMNGLDAARALKLLMPHVPLLMFTNNAGGVLEKEARSAGIAAVISKSDSDALRRLLAHAKALLRSDGASVQRAS